MSDILDGVGTAAEGGLFARALEPASGAKDPHPDQPEHCSNCGTKLTGAYCHACGQKALVHRSLKGVMHDVLHGALHLDSKMWRTLPMLVLRPGRLTRRYIEGARARFVSPMALFLFSVFLMFAVFQVLGIGVSSNPPKVAPLPEVSQGIEQAAQDIRDPASAQEGLKTIIDEVAGIPDRAQAEAAQQEGTQVLAEDSEGSAKVTYQSSGFEWLDNAIVSKWRDNPTLMLYKLQANAYKFSWLLIPISLPFMWLLFVWKRRFKIYDHAIFVTYSLSFMTLMFVALSLLGKAGVGAGWLFTIFCTIAPMHIYRQLKSAYDLSRFSAVWRLLTLISFIFTILLIFLQALFLLGLF